MSAREKTPFGNFELRRSHLVTGLSPKQLAERKAEQDQSAMQARWAAAGCRPLS